MWFLRIHRFPCLGDFWWGTSSIRIVSFSSLVFEGDEIRATWPLIQCRFQALERPSSAGWRSILTAGGSHAVVNPGFTLGSIEDLPQFQGGDLLIFCSWDLVGCCTWNGWISLVGCDLISFHQGMDLGKECEECQERGRFDFEPVVWMEHFREVAGYRS